MRLTAFTDYTLRVLMYMALKYESTELATIEEISRSYNISRNHLMKIVHQLSINGLITTSRGRAGGARLARAPNEISVGQVVRLCEPDFALVECHEDGSQHACVMWQACNLKSAFRRAVDAFLLELDKMTLSDAITRPTVAASLLGLRMKESNFIPIKPAALESKPTKRAAVSAAPGASPTPAKRSRARQQ